MTAAAQQARVAAPSRTARHEHITVIGPWRGGVLARIEEIWRWRLIFPYLFSLFVMKRYRKTYLGYVWVPLRPGIQLLSGGLLFGGFLHVSSGDRPYIIFLAFASAGWTIFDRYVHWSLRALRMSKSLLSGGHFPRAPILLAVAGPAVVDFLLHSLIAVIALLFYLFKGHWYLAPVQQMPVAVAGFVLLLLFGFAFGLFIAPLSDLTKELRYVMRYITQAWMFITPVVYPISQLPVKYQPIAIWNPLTAPLEMMKFGLLSTAPPEPKSILSTFIVLPVLLVVGLRFSNRFEHKAVARL